MKIEILTIFPELFADFLRSSLIGRAAEKGLVEFRATNIRDHASPPHYSVDDAPYGGGAGMVMKPEPLALAIESAKARLPNAKVLHLTPSGSVYTQEKARALSKLPELILVCGRYEGIDERVIELLIDEELSIGDYILMGGEVPAMVVIESVTRLVPNVLGNSESVVTESFEHEEGYLEAPHYTRPPVFRAVKVPEVLTSGDHGKIAAWRQNIARDRTAKRRPDLLKGGSK